MLPLRCSDVEIGQRCKPSLGHAAPGLSATVVGQYTVPVIDVFGPGVGGPSDLDRRRVLDELTRRRPQLSGVHGNHRRNALALGTVPAVSNPARQLAAVLRDWQTVPSGKTTEAFRGDQQWNRHRQAAEHLLEIERYLLGLAATGDDIDHFRETLPAWTAAVFAVGAPWATAPQTPRTVIDSRDIRLLEALGSLMDSTRYAPTFAPDQVEALLKSLADATDLVIKSPSIDDSAKRYLMSLIAEAQRVVTEISVFGEAKLRSTLSELAGAFVGIAEQTGEQSKEGSRFRAAAMDIVKQIFVGTAMLAIDYEARKLGITS